MICNTPIYATCGMWHAKKLYFVHSINATPEKNTIECAIIKNKIIFFYVCMPSHTHTHTA